MTNQILVNITPQETRVAIMELGVPQEIHVERSSARGIVGNLYWGRVARILPGMQSAFVDLGLERAAFLHVGDIWAPRRTDNPPTPIEKTLFEGQKLMVQVIKDPIGTKGARLSTQISIAGRYLVYLPQENHIGISQRIESEDERQTLRQRLQNLLGDQFAGGFIVRTVAESTSDEELRRDIGYLTRLWEELQNASVQAKPPQLLYQDLSLAQRVIRDFVMDDTDHILVDSRENHLKLAEFAEHYSPQALPHLEHYSGARPLFDLYGVEEEIEKALARRVNLKSGGYLIIDQTEAMTTIDINTGGFVGHSNFSETVFKTNLEAAQAVARQLRLRNLGGIIIVDFIDMDEEPHRQAILDEFRKALSLDRTRITLNGFTSLGLIELTRKRTRESLAHVLCEPCPCCKGSAQLKTPQTVCYEILREIVRASRQYSAREFRIIAHPLVIDLFLDEESQSLAGVSDFIGKPITLQTSAEPNQEQYDVIFT
ncbi:MAG: ribonuclease G [Betaproteobacteria bacterium]|nr:ribonuclease G [Betaproteobacteria bacterium]